MNPLTKVGNNFVIPRREPRVSNEPRLSNEPIVSNELVKLDVEHTHHMEDVKLEIQRESHAWRSCCFQLHPASTKFIGKFTVSLIIIGLCSYQLIENINNCTAQIGYSSLLSLVVGSWLNIMV
jgi:hypothetical protein